MDASDPNADGSISGGAFGGISSANPWKDKTSNGYLTVPVGSSPGNTTPWNNQSDIGEQPAFSFREANAVAYQIKNSRDEALDLRSGVEPDVTIFTVYRTSGVSTSQGSALWGLDDNNWD